MTVFNSLPVWLMLATILFLHIASVALRGIYAKIAMFVNIAVHIVLVFLLLAIDAPFDEAVTVYMISVFFYTLFSFIEYKIKGRRKP